MMMRCGGYSKMVVEWKEQEKRMRERHTQTHTSSVVVVVSEGNYISD